MTTKAKAKRAAVTEATATSPVTDTASPAAPEQKPESSLSQGESRAEADAALVEGEPVADDAPAQSERVEETAGEQSSKDDAQSVSAPRSSAAPAGGFLGSMWRWLMTDLEGR